MSVHRFSLRLCCYIACQWLSLLPLSHSVIPASAGMTEQEPE